ncbi:MAG TPA: CAP domain-containing protein [Deltaproteobacteria bacterium]|nr:CAP domain-containing protein [Deltaproteobacteria bacterium]
MPAGTSWLFWTLLTSSPASEQAWCTDLGALVATERDGIWRGTIADRWSVQGSVDRLRVEASGLELYAGSLTDLDPVPAGPDPAEVARVMAALTPGWSAAGSRITGAGFSGAIGSDRVLRGSRRGHEEVWALDSEGVLFGGRTGWRTSIAQLHRDHGTGAGSLHRVVEEHVRQAGGLLRCGPGGRSRVRVGLWPDPLPLGEDRRVMWSTPEGIRVRDAQGRATIYVALPMDRALAANIAYELRRDRPGRRSGVGWRDGIALLALSEDPGAPIPDDVVPMEGEIAVTALLDLEIPAPIQAQTRYPALAPGLEAAAALDRWRTEAGLAPLAWDDELALIALQHAAYLVDSPPGAPHEQDPRAPLYLARDQRERSPAREVVIVSHPERTPEAAIEAWITTPFHRVPLLHPLAQRIGIARLGGVWVAEIAVGSGEGTAVWPTDGIEVPSDRFEGRESPDPLPSWRYPDRIWPVGFPITIWSPDRVVERHLYLDDAEIPHHWVHEPLGSPRDQRHLVPREPLIPGTYRWSVRIQPLDPEAPPQDLQGHFVVPTGRDRPVSLPPSVSALIVEANAERTEPLVATEHAAAAARLLSARTRAMEEGLDPQRVRTLIGALGTDVEVVTKICLRATDQLELDEGLLDPEVHQIGIDARATVVTWRADPRTCRSSPSLRSPRLCLFLLR